MSAMIEYFGMDKVMIFLIIAFFWWQTRESQRP